MRQATDNAYPKYAVLENVPGMYSSGGGADFLEVLNELIQIKQDGFAPDETLSAPLPEKGRWSTSGEIVGDGFSIGWRTLDAQFWGVAQRRRRCYIVVDFTGERAGEILFDESRLRGNPPQSDFSWETTAGGSAAGIGSAGANRQQVVVLNDQGGSYMEVSDNISGTLRSQEHGHQPVVFQSAGFCPEQSAKTRSIGYEDEKSPTLRAGVVPGSVISFEPGITARLGRKDNEEIAPTLRADMGDNQVAVALQNHPADSRIKIDESGTVQTLTERMGTGGGNVPLVMNDRQYALTVGEDVANTLTGTDYKETQCVFEPKTLKIRSGCEGGGKGALVQDNLSATLSTSNDQTIFVPKAYGICSLHSNSMQSSNPHSGIYEAETSRTLDTSVPDPNKNAGGMAIVALEGNGSRPSHRGDGFSDENIAYTLNSVERHAVCYQDKVGALCASDYKFPQNQQIEEGKAVVERVAVENYQHSNYRKVEVDGTLKAKGGDYPGGENMVIENCQSDSGRYVVRRLTPTECALLQGFPPDWCAGLETPNPTEEDVIFWTEIWETDRLIKGTSSKLKSRNQIIKWLQNPHSDSKEYAMWGNGVALPCVIFVLSGIVWAEGL